MLAGVWHVCLCGDVLPLPSYLFLGFFPDHSLHLHPAPVLHVSFLVFVSPCHIFFYTHAHMNIHTHSLSLLYTVQSIGSTGLLLHCPVLLPVLVSSSEWKAACLVVVNRVPPTVTFTENIATLWRNSICEHSEVHILDPLLHPDNVYLTVNSWQHYQFCNGQKIAHIYSHVCI